MYANEIKGEGACQWLKQFVDECQVESDLELLLPANYVTGSSERMLLYRELDGLTLDKDVEAFRSRLEDRFGPVPSETEELGSVSFRFVALQPVWEQKRYSLKQGV